MCRDCGDTMRKVSCCVKLCFKNSDFDAIIVFAPSTPLKMSLTWKLKYGHIKSGTFVIVMLLNKRLTRVQSQKDPRLHFGESANLKIKKDFFFCQCYTIHVLINWLKKQTKNFLPHKIGSFCTVLAQRKKINHWTRSVCCKLNFRQNN